MSSFLDDAPFEKGAKLEGTSVKLPSFFSSLLTRGFAWGEAHFEEGVIHGSEAQAPKRAAGLK